MDMPETRTASSGISASFRLSPSVRKRGSFEGSGHTSAYGSRVVTADGRELLDFSSNDYLGLAGHPALAEAAARAARDQGSGSTASRLIVGGYPALDELEENLAEHKGTEAALVLGSGFLANVGVIPALAGRGDAIFSDPLNHASIVDGCRLSRADVHVYQHRDADHLESLLRGSTADRKLIVTDTVFSMDGDVAPLLEIAELKERYGAALLVDDAHGAGVFGPHGEGFAHEVGVADAVDLHMGTFSKAFGVLRRLRGRSGAVDPLPREHLPEPDLLDRVTAAGRRRSRGAALTLVRELDDERQLLLQRADRFREGLAATRARHMQLYDPDRPADRRWIRSGPRPLPGSSRSAPSSPSRSVHRPCPPARPASVSR